MTEKVMWRTAQIRAVATVAKELDVTIELKSDGSIVCHPRPPEQPAFRAPRGGVKL